MRKIASYVAGKNPESGPIANDTDLFETGLIDSLQFLEYVLYIEEVAEVKIDVSEIDIDDFRTLSALERHLAERRKAAPKAETVEA